MMKRKYLVLLQIGMQDFTLAWLGEFDTKQEAQERLDEKMAESAREDEKDSMIESGWIVKTVGRNYTNT